MKEFKVEEMKEGLPQKDVKTDVDKIENLLKHIVSEVESEITEDKALNNKNGAENSIQKADRLKKELSELYELKNKSTTKDLNLNKKIGDKKDEINKFIESN